METILYRSSDRGLADFGWLKSAHSFSFGKYYDPEKLRFGVLRVLNDDIVAPGKGFGTHPHDNMEIITIPLAGVLKHSDSMGHEQELSVGEVQAMTAGTGLSHSEFNGSDTEPVQFLQIWILPRERNAPPRYSQKRFQEDGRRNRFQLVVSPDGRNDSLAINQQAGLHLGDFEADQTVSVAPMVSTNGSFLFVIDGAAVVNGQRLEARDAMGIWNTDRFDMTIEENARILWIDVPMN